MLSNTLYVTLINIQELFGLNWLNNQDIYWRRAERLLTCHNPAAPCAMRHDAPCAMRQAHRTISLSWSRDAMQQYCLATNMRFSGWICFYELSLQVKKSSDFGSSLLKNGFWRKAPPERSTKRKYFPSTTHWAWRNKWKVWENTSTWPRDLHPDGEWAPQYVLRSETIVNKRARVLDCNITSVHTSI